MGIFSKKKKVESSDLIPRGISMTIPRPSAEDILNIKRQVDYLEKTRVVSKIDKTILQEISDRMYGPESEAYIIALVELNKSFSKRSGRTGSDFYNKDVSSNTKETERKINESIKKND